MVTSQTENRIIVGAQSSVDVLFASAQSICIQQVTTTEVPNGVASMQTFVFLKDTPVPNSSFKLQYALVVKLQIAKDGFVFNSAAIDEDGYGLTYEEAYKDFLTSVRDRYNSLSQREDHLSSEDRAVLASLRKLLGAP
jgi:hypothetical protein